MPTTVLIGHGTFRKNQGSFRVPQNTVVEFFVDDNVGIDDSVASSLERMIGASAEKISRGVTDEIIREVNAIIDEDPIWEGGICVSNRYKIGRRQHGHNDLIKNYQLEAIEGASGSIAYKKAMAKANVHSPNVDDVYDLKTVVGQKSAEGSAADPAVIQWVACRTNMVGTDEAAAPLKTPKAKTGDGTNKCCYLTTAACDAMGLPDGCHELTTLRRYRDEVLLSDARGSRDVAFYYRTAPVILAGIERTGEHRVILEDLFHRWITPSVAAIERRDFETAHRIYREMVLTLLLREARRVRR